MNFFHDFYVQPMNNVYLEMAAMYLIWLIVMLVLHKTPQKILSAVCCALSVGVILLFTVFNRSGGNHDISLIPFITFTQIKTQPEFYRTLFMNIFLFVPFGLCAPFALPDKARKKVVITVLSGLLLSLCVEADQFAFSIGRCETDDVLMNTLGALVGATAFLLYSGIKKLINKRRNNKWKHIRHNY